jgi:hypothetical protein
MKLLDLPRLAKGGVVDDPTVAEVGEHGAEAIVPLENNTGWIKRIAGELKADMSIGTIGRDSEKEFNGMVKAFKDALKEMKVELDNEEMGAFVENTVTRAIYS